MSNAQAAPPSASIYDQLKTDILTGSLQPGIKLRLRDLIEQYNTGNSPLREALNRLSAVGMVIREENRGFRVSPVTPEELMELTRTRCWLEETALRESIAHGDKAWEERIVLAYHWLARSTEDRDAAELRQSPEWEQYHRNFHQALISACGSNILIDFCAELQQRFLRYRNLVETIKYRGPQDVEHHRELQEATLARDADLAVDRLKKHYSTTSEILLANGRFN